MKQLTQKQQLELEQLYYRKQHRVTPQDDAKFEQKSHYQVWLGTQALQDALDELDRLGRDVELYEILTSDSE